MISSCHDNNMTITIILANTYSLINVGELPESRSEQLPLPLQKPGDERGPIQVENPACDYTHASYITLLFTDLGVLTPAAVSDELIRMYQ